MPSAVALRWIRKSTFLRCTSNGLRPRQGPSPQVATQHYSWVPTSGAPQVRFSPGHSSCVRRVDNRNESSAARTAGIVILKSTVFLSPSKTKITISQDIDHQPASILHLTKLLQQPLTLPSSDHRSVNKPHRITSLSVPDPVISQPNSCVSFVVFTNNKEIPSTNKNKNYQKIIRTQIINKWL